MGDDMHSLALSFGAVEYTVSISAERWDPCNECPGYDIKQSYCEASILQELWEMLSASSLPSLPGLISPRVVESDWFLSMGQIEFDIKTGSQKKTYAKLNYLK